MKQKVSLEEIQRLPKIDLHRHLDGKVAYEQVMDLAKENYDKQTKNETKII